jgi:hypothetical protein
MHVRFQLARKLLAGATAAASVGLATVATAAQPSPFGLVLGTSTREDVLRTISAARSKVEVIYPPLAGDGAASAERELEARYREMPNPTQTMIAAEPLASGTLTCARAEFFLLSDTLYKVVCQVASGGPPVPRLASDLTAEYGPPTEPPPGDGGGPLRWEVAGTRIELAGSGKGATISFVDETLAGRSEARRKELIVDPLQLMEEMRRPSQHGGARPGP